jgi:hypothetical protein
MHFHIPTLPSGSGLYWDELSKCGLTSRLIPVLGSVISCISNSLLASSGPTGQCHDRSHASSANPAPSLRHVASSPPDFRRDGAAPAICLISSMCHSPSPLRGHHLDCSVQNSEALFNG